MFVCFNIDQSVNSYVLFSSTLFAKVSERADANDDSKNDVMRNYSYPDMTRTQTRGQSKFILHVEAGSFTDSEIIVLLGENGTG